MPFDTKPMWDELKKKGFFEGFASYESWLKRNKGEVKENKEEDEKPQK